MSSIPLRRLIRLIRGIAEQCESILPADAKGESDEAFKSRIDEWFMSHRLNESVDEAASLCVQLDLKGAAKQLLERSQRLFKDGTDIIFHDLAVEADPEQIALYIETFGPFPIPSGDARWDEGVQLDRRRALLGSVLLLGEYANELLQSLVPETNDDAKIESDVAETPNKYPEHWTEGDIEKWEAAKPRLQFKFKGTALAIKHHIEQYKQEWERRIGTTFPGADIDSLMGMASWAGLSEADLEGMNAWQIIQAAMEALEASGDITPHIKAAKRAAEKSRENANFSTLAFTLSVLLSRLPTCARDNQPIQAARNVEKLEQFLNAAMKPFHESGARFAAVGAIGDIVKICDRVYSSAHEAAVGETFTFLDDLWLHVDPIGRKASDAEALDYFKRGIDEGRGDEPVDMDDPIVSAFTHRTGLKHQLVIERWEHAKAGILELLPADWEQDFLPIGGRIQREEAAANTISAGAAQSMTLPPASEQEQPAGNSTNTNSANIAKLFRGSVPGNSNVVDLVARLDAAKGTNRSHNEIAREFTGEAPGEDSLAQSLLAQIRRLKRKGRINL